MRSRSGMCCLRYSACPSIPCPSPVVVNPHPPVPIPPRLPVFSSFPYFSRRIQTRTVGHDTCQCAETDEPSFPTYLLSSHTFCWGQLFSTGSRPTSWPLWSSWAWSITQTRASTEPSAWGIVPRQCLFGAWGPLIHLGPHPFSVLPQSAHLV